MLAVYQFLTLVRALIARIMGHINALVGIQKKKNTHKIYNNNVLIHIVPLVAISNRSASSEELNLMWANKGWDSNGII